MLRLVSVVGITIAMVIGFVAISTQMRDDYDVRSLVIAGVDDMKALAQRELSCDTADSASVDDTAGTFEPDLSKPDESGKAEKPHAESAATANIFASMDYENINEDTLTIIAVFNDVKGGSGNLRIKAGRQISLHCSCAGKNINCQIADSNINKKYIPGKRAQ